MVCRTVYGLYGRQSGKYFQLPDLPADAQRTGWSLRKAARANCISERA